MKIAVVGGGGWRTPLLYHGLVQRAGSMPDAELVLHDTSQPWLTRVQRIIRGLDEQLVARVPVAVTTDLEAALDGADFVLTAIRAGGFDARRWDEAIPLAHGVVGQETVGPGGFGLALRNIPALRHIARTMTHRCPGAWMVNLTNPAGLATEALQDLLGDRVIGVCDSPTALTRGVAAALEVDADELHVSYGGLNHLGWLTAAVHHGQDLLPRLLGSDRLADVEEARLIGVDSVRALGALPNEYLYFYERAADVLANTSRNGSRGEFLADRRKVLASAIDEASTPAEALAAYRRSLAQRQDTYLTVESGIEREPTSDVFADAGGYHEIALSVVAAIACDAQTVAIVNTRNRGALDFLPDDAIIEVTAVVRGAGAFPLAADVPTSQQGLVAQVKEFESLTLAAIGARSRRRAARALAAHPLVPSKGVADAILARYAERIPLIADVLEAA